MCILENYPECSNPRVFYIIPYFCGQHPQCRYLVDSRRLCPSWFPVSHALIFSSTREPGVWALERAKQNVLENYLLVGILEELEDVLLLLERLLPHYFTGVLNIYKSPGMYACCWQSGRNAGSKVTGRSHSSFTRYIFIQYRPVGLTSYNILIYLFAVHAEKIKNKNKTVLQC